MPAPRHSGPRHSGPRQSGPRQSGPRHSGPPHSAPRPLRWALHRASPGRLPWRPALLRAAALGAALFWAALPTGPAAAQSVDLAWKLEEGQRLEWTFRQATETQTAILGSDDPPVKIRVDMTMRATWTVGPASDEAAAVTQRIDAVRLKMTAPPQDEILWDSEDEPAGAPAGLGDRLQPLIGAELTMRISPRGEVLSAELSQQAEQSLGDADPETIKQLLRGALLTLPDKPVRTGSTWRDEMTAPARLGELKIQRTYTLAESTADGPRRISMEGVLSLTPAPREDGRTVRLRRQSLSGEYRFDVEAGRLAGAAVRQETLTDSTYRDSRVAVRAISTLTSEVRPAPQPAAQP